MFLIFTSVCLSCDLATTRQKNDPCPRWAFRREFPARVNIRFVSVVLNNTAFNNKHQLRECLLVFDNCWNETVLEPRSRTNETNPRQFYGARLRTAAKSLFQHHRLLIIIKAIDSESHSLMKGVSEFDPIPNCPLCVVWWGNRSLPPDTATLGMMYCVEREC